MAGAFPSCRAGRYVLIGTYGGSFHALAATDGAVAWTFRAGGDIKAAAVVDPASGLCAVGSYDGHMCAPMGLAGYPTLSAAARAHHSFAVYVLPSAPRPSAVLSGF